MGSNSQFLPFHMLRRALGLPKNLFAGKLSRAKALPVSILEPIGHNRIVGRSNNLKK